MKKLLLSLGSLSAVLIPAISVVSCAASTTPNSDGLLPLKDIAGRKESDYKIAPSAGDSFGADMILANDSYNDLYTEMKTHPNTVAFAVIANKKVYTDIVKITKGETVIEALDTSKFIFKRYMHEQMGAFINSFALRSKPNEFMHGTNNEKNYGDWYPMYYINHVFAQLGVSNYHLLGAEVLEISYDKE